MIEIVRSALIPAINTFCGVPIIEADQTGDKPTGTHATYKFTSPRIKDSGQAEETTQYEAFFIAPHTIAEVYQIKRVEQYKIVVSITAIDESVGGSLDLANKIYDWFDFYGADTITANNIAITSKTNIQNRDIFISDYYERRNGFDVTLRVTQTIERDIDSIGKVTTNETFNQ